MKNLRLVIAILGVLFLANSSAWCDEPAQLPDTPVGKQTKRLFEALQSGKQDQIKAFIEENLAASFLEAIPLGQHVDINTRFAMETGGLVPQQITSASETNLRLIAEAKNGGRYEVMVEVEAAKPHKISGLGFGRADPTSEVQLPPIPEGPLNHAQVAAWTEECLEDLCAADAFSGAVLIGYRDKVLFAKACGLASRAWNQPNRVDTKFNLGSMNKMFTSVAIAQLMEKGKVSLDDTIGKHLPEYPNGDAAEKVTVRHLLTHTSGLADYFNDKFMNASRARFRAIEDYFPLFADEPLQFEPGSRFRYSNAGFMVLGAIVQSAADMDYFEYVRQHIYEPTGMVNSDAYELDTDVPNLAVGYTQDREGKRAGRTLRNNLFMHVIKGGPAGGGYSTVEDLHRFANALREGTLISSETLQQWTTPGDKNRSYAFGFEVYQSSNTKVIGHRGGFPGISSGLALDLDTGYTVAVMANMDSRAVGTLMERIKELLSRVKT